MVALVICDRSTRKRSDQAVHISMIITLLLQRRLRVSNYLVGRQVISRVNRTIPGVIRVGIVAPCGEPVARVPKIRSAEHEYDAVVMAVPPVLIVPFRFVVAESSILVALPVLASFNAPALLKLHRWGLSGIWLFWNVEVLGLDWLRFCLGNIGFTLFCFASCLSAGHTLTGRSGRRSCAHWLSRCSICLVRTLSFTLRCLR